MILHGPNGEWVIRNGSAPVTCPHRMSLSTPLVLLDGVHRGEVPTSGDDLSEFIGETVSPFDVM